MNGGRGNNRIRRRGSWRERIVFTILGIALVLVGLNSSPVYSALVIFGAVILTLIYWVIENRLGARIIQIETDGTLHVRFEQMEEGKFYFFEHKSERCYAVRKGKALEIYQVKE